MFMMYSSSLPVVFSNIDLRVHKMYRVCLDMRRVHVSRTRSRSRSRSPLLRGPRPVVSKTQPVNMLDQAALLAVRSMFMEISLSCYSNFEIFFSETGNIALLSDLYSVSGKKESKPFTPKERIVS